MKTSAPLAAGAAAEALSLAALADADDALADALALADEPEPEAELADPLLLLLQATTPMTDRVSSAAVAIANSFFFM